MDVIARDSIEIAARKTAETDRLPEGRQVVGPEWFQKVMVGIGGEPVGGLRGVLKDFGRKI